MRLEWDNLLILILALYGAYWHLRIWVEFRLSMTITRRLIKLLVVAALLFMAIAEVVFMAGMVTAVANTFFGLAHGVLVAALVGLGMSDYAEKWNRNKHDH